MSDMDWYSLLNPERPEEEPPPEPRKKTPWPPEEWDEALFSWAAAVAWVLAVLAGATLLME